MHSFGQPHGLQSSLRPLETFPQRDTLVTIIQHGEHHVLQRASTRQQVIRLEDKANALVANAGQLGLAETTDVFPVEAVGPISRAVQAPQDVHQRALARARWTHNRHKLPWADGHIHAPQRVHLDWAHAIHLGQAVRLDYHQAVPCLVSTIPVLTVSPALSPETISA